MAEIRKHWYEGDEGEEVDIKDVKQWLTENGYIFKIEEPFKFGDLLVYNNPNVKGVPKQAVVVAAGTKTMSVSFYLSGTITTVDVGSKEYSYFKKGE